MHRTTATIGLFLASLAPAAAAPFVATPVYAMCTPDGALAIGQIEARLDLMLAATSATGAVILVYADGAGDALVGTLRPDGVFCVNLVGTGADVFGPLLPGVEG